VEPERWREIDRLYHEAWPLGRTERSAYLDRACGDDADLRREVEGLLAEASEAEPFIEKPALHVVAQQEVAAWLEEPSRVAPTAGEQLGEYQILRSLGSGGMGDVYLAHDPHLDRDVAIKLLPAHLGNDPVARERLRREALAAAALDNPFICKIYQIGEQDGRLFCVMEYVRGQTLQERMQASPLSRAEALRIAGEVAEAIEEAQAHNFVHRDLKPANVMITPQGRAKVMDFGLAKRLETMQILSAESVTAGEEAALTALGMVIGTPDYMSPEQARGAPVDLRSDLFSFGILLSQMLTCTHPFRRASTAETVAAILRDPPFLEMEGTAQLPVGLLLVLRRLLAKAPGERYQSMREVRADLARLAAASATAAAGPEPEGTAHIPLIGRSEEQTELTRLLKAAVGGCGSMVLIGGEPGVGKTHLVRAILAEAQRDGCLSLVGCCSEMEGAPPYEPFIQMLEYSARIAPYESFRQAIGDAAPEVAKLMPELRRMYPDIPPPMELPPEQQRRFLFNAYRDFVERSARVTPILAVFEDLHWADEPTLLLLQHLAQTLATSPILIIGTYRDVEVEVGQPLARMMESLLRQKLAVRMSLRPLTAAEVARMLAALSGQTPPQPLARTLFEETEGNPYFVEEVFRCLAEEGQLFDQGGAWRTSVPAGELHVPESVRLVIGRRLARLGDETRRVMTVAAVIGRSFLLRWLEDVSGQGPDAALEAIEAAERAHLVSAEPGGREPRYRFVHELVRQTLAETLSRPRRQRLHARVAQLIEQLHADNLDSHTSALAHHLYYAGSAADRDKTVEWLTRASRQASAATAYEDALACLDNALSLTDGDRSTRVAELLAGKATVLRSLGRPAEAVAAYEQALQMFAALGEAGRFAEISIPLILIFSWGLRLGEARELASRALNMLGPEISPRRIGLLGAQALCAVCSGDPDAALALLEDIQQIVGPSPEGAAAGMIWQLRTHVEWNAGRIPLAVEASGHAARVFKQAGDVWGQVDVNAVRACATILAGRLQDAETIVRETVPLAERVGHGGCLWMCKAAFAELSLAAGDLEGAHRFVREAIELGEAIQMGWNFVGAVELANIARLRGLTPESLEWSRRAMAWEPARHSFSGYSQASLALTLAQTGDPEALSALREAQRYLPVPGRRAPIGTWQAVGLVIEGLASIGRFEEAARLQPLAEEFAASGIEVAFRPPLPRTVAGIAAACAGDWPRAEEHHRAAMQLADAMPHRVAQAVAWFWYAAMLRARGGSEDAARHWLSEATKMLDALGMTLYSRLAGAARAAQAGE
jgi:tetratricopeptide (TPR) repeat protein/predicted Ser/Thr protein kinase